MTKLSQIREKVIAVNPEIKTVRVPCLCKGHGNCPFQDHVSVGRPIRLADVLLAMGKSEKVHAVTTDVYGKYLYLMHTSENNYFSRQAWNLKQDNLESQSEETISFIHKILCQ